MWDDSHADVSASVFLTDKWHDRQIVRQQDDMTFGKTRFFVSDWRPVVCLEPQLPCPAL